MTTTGYLITNVSYTVKINNNILWLTLIKIYMIILDLVTTEIEGRAGFTLSDKRDICVICLSITTE